MRELISIENIAVVFSIGFIVFNAKGKILSWPLGIIGSLLYTIVFYQAKIYGDMFLQIVYVVLGIYGWVLWNEKSSEESLTVLHASRKLILKYLLIGFILSPIFGLVLDNYTDSDIQYWDSLTTVFSFISTWMMAKRYIENWFFWIVIDSVCCAIYSYKGLYPTALLFFVYTIMAMYGSYSWNRNLNKQII